MVATSPDGVAPPLSIEVAESCNLDNIIRGRIRRFKRILLLLLLLLSIPLPLFVVSYYICTWVDAAVSVSGGVYRTRHVSQYGSHGGAAAFGYMDEVHVEGPFHLVEGC